MMSYILNTLTTVAGCDGLINDSSHDKAALVARKGYLLRRVESSNQSGDILERITQLTSRINQVELNIAASTSQSDIIGLELDLAELTRTRAIQQRRLLAIGEHYAIMSQHEEFKLDAEIAVIDAFIAALTAHRATLPPDEGEAVA